MRIIDLVLVSIGAVVSVVFSNYMHFRMRCEVLVAIDRKSRFNSESQDLLRASDMAEKGDCLLRATNGGEELLRADKDEPLL